MALPPAQTEEGPVIEQVGFGLTVSVWLQVEVHPLALVMVTVYVPAVVRVMHWVVAPVLH